jgi:hypothetical protein
MIAAVLGTAAVAAPAAAQLNTSQGLVTVTVQDVSILNDFLNNDQIAALNNLNVPISVQVPVGVAANVCDVNASVLAKTKAGGATCAAKSGSKALAQSVSKQLLTQKK